MGYTNYWTIEKPISTENFNKITRELEECEVIFPHLFKIEYIDDNSFTINGWGKDSHETFTVVKNHVGSNSCKTNRKPYDFAVWHILMYMNYLLGKDFEVSRDR